MKLLYFISKKDAVVRQSELFDYCKSYFLEYFTNNILTTLKDGFKGFMMTEMIERLPRRIRNNNFIGFILIKI